MGGRKTARGAAVLAAAVAATTAAPASASPVPQPPELWIMNADGTEQHLVSGDADWLPSPAFSPDGGSVAFVTNEGNVAVADSDGDSVPVSIGRGTHPDWSPDGSLVAFAGHPPSNGGPGTLYVVRPDGSGLTPVAGAVAPGPLSWSPDGSRIAYHRCDGTPCTRSLAIVAADGSGETILAPADYGTDPSWAPDGGAIAFGANADVWVVDLSSGVLRNLTPGSDPGWEPDWGSGERIAYAGELGRTYVVDSDGSDRAFAHDGGSPQWAPDGGPLLTAFQGDLFLKVPGTMGAPNVTNTDAIEYGGRWSPDGGRIAYLRERPPDPGGERHERAVSASLSGRVILGRVEVVGDFAACASRLPVLLQRYGRRGWSEVDRGETTRRGRFEFELGRREGLYRVKAPRAWTRARGNYEPDECAATSTPPLRYRR